LSRCLNLKLCKCSWFTALKSDLPVRRDKPVLFSGG
jgi:hypothetical protein